MNNIADLSLSEMMWRTVNHTVIPMTAKHIWHKVRKATTSKVIPRLAFSFELYSYGTIETIDQGTNPRISWFYRAGGCDIILRHNNFIKDENISKLQLRDN